MFGSLTPFNLLIAKGVVLAGVFQKEVDIESKCQKVGQVYLQKRAKMGATKRKVESNSN